jgi:general secretion pathway protein N
MRRSLNFRFSLIALAGCVWSLSTAAAATNVIMTEALDAGIAGETSPDRPAGGPEPVTSVHTLPPLASVPNPLWAIPLKQLPQTRERPVFSPSRRPPPAVAAAEPAPVAPPPRIKPPEPPPLSLVGTIASDEESFGIFLDNATKDALRLKIGEDYHGWRLRSIHGRQVTIQKDQQTAVLTLPLPGTPSGSEVQLIPVSINNQPPHSARTR